MNARKEVLNLKKLLHERIDVTTLPKSQLSYYIKSMQLDGQLYVSSMPLISYGRHILVTKKLQAEYKFISQFSRGLSKNVDWDIILKKYGLSEQQ